MDRNINIGSYYSVNISTTASMFPSTNHSLSFHPFIRPDANSFHSDANAFHSNHDNGQRSDHFVPTPSYPNGDQTGVFSAAFNMLSSSILNVSFNSASLISQQLSNGGSFDASFNPLTDAYNTNYNLSTNYSRDTLMDANNESNISDIDSGYIPYSQRPETYIVPIVFLIIFITGIIGNVTLIILLIKEQLIKVPSYLYILNLSIGDLIVILGTVPFAGTIYTFESWPFGLVVCKFSEFIRDVSIGVSVLTLSAMSIDRYKAAFSTTIRAPAMRGGGYRSYNSKRGSSHSTLRYVLISSIKTPTGKIMLVIWIISIVTAIPSAYFSFILPIRHPQKVNESIYICYPYPDYLGPIYPKVVVLLKCLCYYVIPLIIISCCYVSIAVHLWNKSKQTPMAAASPATVGTSPGKFSVGVNKHGACNNLKCHHLSTTSFSTPTLNINTEKDQRSMSPAQQVTPKRSTINYGSSASDERIEQSACLLNRPDAKMNANHSNADICNNSTNTINQHQLSGRESVNANASAASGLGRSRRKSQSRAKLIMLLVIIFLVCFFPNHLFMMWFYYYPNSQRLYNLFWHVWRIMAFCLTFTSSTLNPITLYLTSDQFKVLFHKYLHSNCYKDADQLRDANSVDAKIRTRCGDKDKDTVINQIDSSDDANYPSGVHEHININPIGHHGVCSSGQGINHHPNVGYQMENMKDAKVASDHKLAKTFSNILEEDSIDFLSDANNKSPNPSCGQDIDDKDSVSRCSSTTLRLEPESDANQCLNPTESCDIEIRDADRSKDKNNSKRLRNDHVSVQLGVLDQEINHKFDVSVQFMDEDGLDADNTDDETV